MTRIGAFAGLGILFALIGLFAYLLVTRPDPSALPSALIGKPLADFALPPLAGRPKAVAPDGLALADLRMGRVSVVNVWASWCTPCRSEMPLLRALARREDIVLHGIDWKDKAPDGAAFLRELGDPFVRIGSDETGRTGIDWGVYGVPETYVIDGAGRVVARLAGPLTAESLARVIEPAIVAAHSAPAP